MLIKSQTNAELKLGEVNFGDIRKNEAACGRRRNNRTNLDLMKNLRTRWSVSSHEP